MTVTLPAQAGLSPVVALPTPSSGVTGIPRWQQQYSARLRVTDSVIVCAAIMLAQFVRFGDSPNMSGYPGPVMTLFSCVFAMLWLSSIAVFHTRSPRIIGAGIDEYRRIASASFSVFGIIAMVTLLAKIDLARGYLAVALPVGTLGLLASRNLWRKYVWRKRAEGRYQTMVLAIGDRPGVAHLAHELIRNPKDGHVVVGVCIPGYGPQRGETLKVAGPRNPDSR